jgi:hypothetical protein
MKKQVMYGLGPINGKDGSPVLLSRKGAEGLALERARLASVATGVVWAGHVWEGEGYYRISIAGQLTR